MEGTVETVGLALGHRLAEGLVETVGTMVTAAGDAVVTFSLLSLKMLE